MIQPEGTVTYKGRRKSKPGEQSLIPSKDEKIVNAAADFYSDGKKVEKKGFKKAEKKEVEKTNLFNGEEK